MRRFELHKNFDILRRLVEYDLEMAKLVENELLSIYSREEVRRVYFNVIFPKKYVHPEIHDKYILMTVNSKTTQIICL